MTRLVRFVAAVTAGVTLAGCDDSPAEPEMTPFDFMIPQLGTAVPLAGPFEGVFPCPAGGTLERRGTHSFSESNGELTSVWDVTTSHSACTLEGPFGKVTMDGSMQSAGTVRYRHGNDPGVAPTLLALESRQHGSMTTTQNGASRSCALDLTQKLDAASGMLTLEGTACGRQVSIRMPVPQLRR